MGFGFHEMYNEPYWLDDAAYVFTFEEIERDIETASQDLHDMCMDLVADIVTSEERLERLAIPSAFHDAIHQSWLRGDRHLYGRFDLAYAGQGPAKLLEYNADTPTSVFESAYFQHNWLTDQIALGNLPADADQFNSIQEALVEAFRQFPADRPFHFAAMTDDEEDRGTTIYLMDCAIQAGHQAELLDIRDIGIDQAGRFTDLKDATIHRCFKLYPWEMMLTDPFAANLLETGHVFVEPIWKSVLSNKGILPLLWQSYPNHPNLLPSFFADDARAAELTDYVCKPLFSREGNNVSVFLDQKESVSKGGEYGEEGKIIQAFSPLFQSDHGHAVLGSWIVGDTSCGIGVREDDTCITANLSRFVPHMILD